MIPGRDSTVTISDARGASVTLPFGPFGAVIGRMLPAPGEMATAFFGVAQAFSARCRIFRGIRVAPYRTGGARRRRAVVRRVRP